jgi:putative ABC transport system ATP-binding protein
VNPTIQQQHNRDVPLVQARAAGHTYGEGPSAVVAVHDVTCEIWQRDRIAVTGPSGSGKSTLLYLLAGLERPTAGIVEWPSLGTSPVGRPTEAGLVFQGPSLIPALDVAENVGLPLVIAGVSDTAARQAALKALDVVGIASLAQQLPDQLSGGQAQRAAIARVLATEPALILADEPTGQLDQETGRQVIDALLTTADHIGAALVVSTHDPAVAGRLGTQWHLVDGELDHAVTAVGGRR